MDITYGFDIKSHENTFLQATEHAAECSKRTMIPGAFLVDIFPIRSSNPPIPIPHGSTDNAHKVKHVPEWFPGAGFKHFAKKTRGMLDLAIDGPLEYVKETFKVRSCGPH